MDAKSVRNMYSIIAVTNKHTAKLHHVGSLYILTYDARKLKHKRENSVVSGSSSPYAWSLPQLHYLGSPLPTRTYLMNIFGVRENWLYETK